MASVTAGRAPSGMALTDGGSPHLGAHDTVVHLTATAIGLLAPEQDAIDARGECAISLPRTSEDRRHALVPGAAKRRESRKGDSRSNGVLSTELPARAGTA